MTILQKLQLRQSEIRQAINTLLGNDARTDEQQGELEKLTGEGQKIEPELRAALIAAPDPEVTTITGDSETRERAELASQDRYSQTSSGRRRAARRSLARLRSMRRRLISRPTGHLPMALFGRTTTTNPHVHFPTVETRAITAAPAVDGPLQPLVPYVFEKSAAASLGIMMPSVPSGQVQIPKITTAPPSDTLAKDGSAPATAAAVSLVNQAPVRIAGSFEVRVEDLAVMPSLETALGESLQGSMSNEFDEQVFNGTATELNGLFTQAADESVAGAVETYTTGIGRFAGLVDGKHAYTLADVRAVIGSKTFALYAGLFANSNKGDMSLFDYLTQMLGSIRVSDRVPGVSSSAQRCICVLTASAEMPKIHVWDAMQVIRDPYSGAGAGKVTITATALVSPLYVPHGVAQVKEVRPKLS